MRFRSLWSRIHELERRLLPAEEVEIIVIPSTSGLSWEEHHRTMQRHKDDGLDLPMVELPHGFANIAADQGDKNDHAISRLEVLDTERSLFDSELNASRTLQEIYGSVVTLYAALGGGWDPAEPGSVPTSLLPVREQTRND